MTEPDREILGPPRGWTREEENEHYAIYRARKIARGEEPRERDEWREQVRFRAEMERRGNRFRDIAWEELGYQRSADCKPERYQPTTYGKRYQDIGDRSELTAWEFKTGGGVKSEGLMQLAKDEEMLDRDWTIIWVARDGSKLDREVRERAEQLARDNPGDFYYVDLSNDQSIADFGRDRPREAEALRQTADRFDREEAERAELERREEAARRAELARQQAVHAELEREAAVRAQSPEAAEAMRLNRGTATRAPHRTAQRSHREPPNREPGEPKRDEVARDESPEAAEAMRRSPPTFGKPATGVRAPEPDHDLDQEAVRTTPAAEAAVRQQRAHGNLINGSALNRVQGVSHRGIGRGDIGGGMGRGR